MGCIRRREVLDLQPKVRPVKGKDAATVIAVRDSSA
jgi:hypothetical protein